MADKLFPTDFTETTSIWANDYTPVFKEWDDMYKIKTSSLKGDKWDKWDTGDTGPQGIQWATGATWPQWPQGETWPAGADGKSFTWKGAYSAVNAYVPYDIVSYNGSTYNCILNSIGNLPTNTTYFALVAAKWLDWAGSGDISGSGVANEIAYFTAEKTINNLPVATYPSLTELSYVKWVTSAIQTQIWGKVDKSTYDAHSILAATTDDTPVAVTVAEQTVVGRTTWWNITALAIDSDLSSVSANDDTIPSAKATKTALDLKAPLASPTFTGTVTLPTTALWESSLQLDPTLSANGKRSGITKTGTAWAALTFWQVCYFATSGKWLPVDWILDWTDTGFSKKLGMCILAASGDWQATEMLEYWYIYATAFPTLTIWSPAYLSDTAWEIVVEQPTTTNFAIRVVWYGETADILKFNPDQSYIVHI